MKKLFDLIRSIKGSGLTQAEVDRINATLAASSVPEKTNVPESEWLDLAEPILHQFEGFGHDLGGGKVRAYQCPAGVWTIGYGTTGPDVHRGTVWTHERAKRRYARDVRNFAEGVRAILGPEDNSTPAQFAALVSLAYNIGLAALSRSTLMKMHKAGNHDGAAKQFLRWNKAGRRVLRGLTRRREVEAGLYRSGS